MAEEEAERREEPEDREGRCRMNSFHSDMDITLTKRQQLSLTVSDLRKTLPDSVLTYTGRGPRTPTFP